MLPDLSLNDVSLDGLLELVDKQVSESQRLEFKEQPYGEYNNGRLRARNEHKREMLRDITAMANAQGGYLIIGIQEDSNGCATGLKSVNNPYEITNSMRNLCNQGILDPVQGLQFKVIEIMLGMDGAIVIYVPKSNHKPHMVCLHGRTDFYYRYDTTVQAMTLRQIETEFISSPRNLELLKSVGVSTEELESQIDIRKKGEGVSYIEVIERRPAAQFFSRFMRPDNEPSKLLIVSPFIGNFEGYQASFRQILEKCASGEIRVHVVTRHPADDYHKLAIETLLEYDYVDVKLIDNLHAKLFVSWSTDSIRSFALVGSANLTASGVYHNLELGVLISSRDHGSTLVEKLYTWGAIEIRTRAKAIRSLE